MDLKAPLPASLEFLTLIESSLWPSGWPASRFDAESQTVTLPRLRDVELGEVKLCRGAMAALPASVERLWICGTMLSQSCFQSDPAKQAVVSPPSRLTELNFSGSNNTALEIRDATTAWPHVTTLKLNECSACCPFLHFVNNMDRLEVLEANDILSLTNWDVRLICLNLGTLRRLSIAGSQLTTTGAWSIADKLTHLESLDISGCRQLSPVAFFMFAGLRSTLRFLNVLDTNVDSGIVDVLRLCMPACNVVH